MQNVQALLMKVKAVLEVQRAAVAEISAYFVTFHKVRSRLTRLQLHLLLLLLLLLADTVQQCLLHPPHCLKGPACAYAPLSSF